MKTEHNNSQFIARRSWNTYSYLHCDLTLKLRSSYLNTFVICVLYCIVLLSFTCFYLGGQWARYMVPPGEKTQTHSANFGYTVPLENSSFRALGFWIQSFSDQIWIRFLKLMTGAGSSYITLQVVNFYSWKYEL